jgi:hypothetical protein
MTVTSWQSALHLFFGGFCFGSGWTLAHTAWGWLRKK